MGQTCSRDTTSPTQGSPRQESPDPAVYDLMRRSVDYYEPHHPPGQQHLLYRQQSKSSGMDSNAGTDLVRCPTRVLVRRHSLRHYEEGMSGTHIYAIRYPEGKPLELRMQQEQAPRKPYKKKAGPPRPSTVHETELSVHQMFRTTCMVRPPTQKVADWVTVSEEHEIYVADVGLTAQHCDRIVQVTEQVCRGQYAAYTYAKQTLGCREFPVLARVCQPPVHTITHAIMSFSKNRKLSLDEREPHIVKYDVTKRERQKLDMHTDKSEWTFLISLSNGAGMDYEGGGTYFECIDSTVHIQRGHALIFPGKLRHCGQRITRGLRFLLVGFLVDNTEGSKSSSEKDDPDTIPAHVAMNIP